MSDKIDAALAIEMKALRRQDAMNDLMDRGVSEVQDFYKDAVVFITGGTGFLGKQLIEKLFRSCSIKKMYLLTRERKGKSIAQRLQHTFENPVFDLLRKKQPNFTDKIIPVEGNVAYLRLGLSDEDWTTLKANVNVIFHLAATVNFEEAIHISTIINVRGTREAIGLAKECSNFKKFIHVSTTYCQATFDRIGKKVLEEVYQSPVPPDVMINLAENTEPERLVACTRGLIKGWPNTYTFTKAIAEDLVKTKAGDLPVCIVRPPIVTSSYYEPGPGWADLSTLNGPIGLFFGLYIGFIHVFQIDHKKRFPIAPVDIVNNTVIAAGWDSEARRQEGHNDVPVYTISKMEHLIHPTLLGHIMRTQSTQLVSPKCIWKCGGLDFKSSVWYWTFAILFHYIPAYIIDAILLIPGVKPKNIPIKSVVGIYKKIDKFRSVYQYFLFNEWEFRDDNVQAMIKRMSDADRAIYNCDLTTIDVVEYILVWSVGLRRYVVKDGLKNTDVAVRNQKWLTIANYVFLVVYFYAIWTILSTFWSILVYMF